MIVVIPAGGTVSGVRNERGLLSLGHAPTLLDLVRSTAGRLGLTVEIVGPGSELTASLQARDSCDFGPKDLLVLHTSLAAIDANGVVILHGTDTMTCTAAALNYLAPVRPFPVILTGSQVAHGEPGSDAVANITLALRAAAGEFGKLPGETLIAFDGKILRGVRASKTSSHSLDAFHSDQQTIIDLEGSGQAHRLPARHLCVGQPAISFSEPVISLAITPNFDPRLLLALCKDGLKGGLLLNLFGVGSAPHASKLVDIIDELDESGWLCLSRSTCIEGRIDWYRYSSTLPFQRSRLIDGRDIMHDAAVVKLMAALALDVDQPQKKAWLTRNVAGEFVDREIKE